MSIREKLALFIGGALLKSKIELRLSVITGVDNLYALQGDHLHYSLEDDSTSALCIDLILTAIATMSGGFHDSKNNSMYKEFEDLLANPNIRETHYIFLYSLVKDYFYGNAFIRVHDGWLERLNPDLCIIDLALNVLLYAESQGRKSRIPLQNIIHIPSRFGYDGVLGKNIFTTFKPVYNRTHNIDTFTEDRYNSNGTLTKRLIVDISDTVEAENEEKLAQFKRDFVAKYQGAKNANVPLVKLNGITYETLDTGVPTQSSSMELTDNRKFQVEEICRLFNVPPQMVNGTSGYSNEVFIAFVQNAVKPVAEEFAQRFTKLLPLEARGRHQYEWDYQSLERTNSTQQMANIKDRLTYGILTINEIRAERNEPFFKDPLLDEPMVAAGKLPLSYLLEKLKQEEQLAKDNKKQEQQVNNLMMANPTGGTNGSNSLQFHQDNPGQQDNLIGSK